MEQSSKATPLLSFCRRIGSLETKLEGIDAKLQDTREVERERGMGLKERLEEWDKSLKGMQRGIQLIRDRQELLDAQAELAQLKKADEEARKAQAAKDDSAAKPGPTAAASTAMVSGILCRFQTSCASIKYWPITAGAHLPHVRQHMMQDAALI